MDKQTRQYRIREFKEVAQADEYMPQIKITRTCGQTKWLSITDAELDVIRKILVGAYCT